MRWASSRGPRGLAIDDEGRVIVCDTGFCNVQVFQPDGAPAAGARLAPSGDDGPGRYLLPAKVAADETGRLYVVDQYLHKVEVIRRLAEPQA